MPARATRRDDERLLGMLALRCAGVSSAAIAERVGAKPEGVRIATTRVRNDDLEQSGEPARVVLAGYRWGE